MHPFDFQSASDVQEALKDPQDASKKQFLAGGTTLVDLMKLHVFTPKTLIDLSPLHLNKISEESSSIRVDALVTNSEMAENPLITAHFPVVSEALLSGASVQLRNVATTAGNLLQRTRCSYFRDTHCACNKREPGTGCSAIGGYNRMHAIYGTSTECIAAHPSDLCVSLMALEAVIHTEHAGGGRQIPISGFYSLPGNTPHIENVLRPGELITSIHIPKIDWFKKSRYVKIRDRSSYAFALTSAAVALDLRKGVVHDSRIALGGVGTIPWRALEVEKMLKGQTLSTENIKKSISILAANAKPNRHNSFKIQLIQHTLARAIQEIGAIT